MDDLTSDHYRRLNATLHVRDPRYGGNGRRWAIPVAKLLKTLDARSMLDYGAGKGSLVAELAPHFHRIEFQQYDPAVPRFAARPRPSDVVICTDVLEHVEPAALDPVLDDLRALTRRAVFLVIATRESSRILADGRNAHLTVREVGWWMERVERRWSVVMSSTVAEEFVCVAVPPGTEADWPAAGG